MIEIGREAPAFELKNQDEKLVTLKSFSGRTVILYFYPKDLTSGCTQESCDFRDSLTSFNSLNAVVMGVSADPPDSHRKFIAKYKLNFDLLSDESKEMLITYGVWKEKSMYGRKFMGIERTTVIINPEGKITHIFAKVSVRGHVQAVKQALSI
jgi:peroxiredoxin Q/BCP